MADPGPGGGEPFWVFGYGSLMWDPGFPHVERRRGRVCGYRRRLCLWSLRYRGTPEAPGLVLGLDAEPDAVCTGIAFRVAPAAVAATRRYLDEREMISYAYRETRLRVTLVDAAGRAEGGVTALTYVMDPTHAQYAAGLDPARAARIVAASRGLRGDNRDYLENTLRHLDGLGVREPELEAIGRRVAALAAPAPEPR